MSNMIWKTCQSCTHTMASLHGGCAWWRLKSTISRMRARETFLQHVVVTLVGVRSGRKHYTWLQGLRFRCGTHALSEKNPHQPEQDKPFNTQRKRQKRMGERAGLKWAEPLRKECLSVRENKRDIIQKHIPIHPLTQTLNIAHLISRYDHIYACFRWDY